MFESDDWASAITVTAPLPPEGWMQASVLPNSQADLIKRQQSKSVFVLVSLFFFLS